MQKATSELIHSSAFVRGHRPAAGAHMHMPGAPCCVAYCGRIASALAERKLPPWTTLWP